VNIGNQTSVKLVDIMHIEHRTAVWHRYRFGRLASLGGLACQFWMFANAWPSQQ